MQAYQHTLRSILQSARNAASLRSALGLEAQPLRRAFSTTQPSLRSTLRIAYRPKVTNPVKQSYQSPFRTNKRSFHNSSRTRSSKSNSSKSEKQEPQGLSAKLKKLSKEYGWVAVGVYLGLSVLDFPFCFLLVRVVGTDRIGEIEHVVVSHATKLIPESVRDRWNAYRAALKEAKQEQEGEGETNEDGEVGWGVEEAQKRNKGEASLTTQLALAYAIHKSFIFLRVPLTAAVTPKVVKVLRSWGWNIGKRTK